MWLVIIFAIIHTTIRVKGADCSAISSQLCSKLKAVRAEMADYRDEQGRVREELALTLDELQRDLKLKYVIHTCTCSMSQLYARVKLLMYTINMHMGRILSKLYL